ncbi:MAG: HAD family hydrolase [Pirellulaceae bacterium]
MVNDRLRIFAGGDSDVASSVSDPPHEIWSRESIEVVFFDLCGVLYDESYWLRWLLQLVSRIGLHTHYTLFYRAWECEFQDEVCRGHIDYWHALKLFLRSAGLSRAQIDEVVAAGMARFRAFEEQIRPFPHVVAALSQLASQDVHLAISSALPLTVEALKTKLQRLQLTEWFGKVSTCGDSPDARSRRDHFRNQLAEFQISPAHAAYVGRRREDLTSAAEAGLLTVAYNQDADAVADVYVEQFDQLPHAIRCRPPSMLAAS